MYIIFNKRQLENFIKKHVVDGLVGKDINVNGITSKGIANTGAIGNIGNVTISGDLNVQGTGKGKVVANTLEQKIPNWELDIKSMLNPNFFKDSSNLYAKLVLLGNELSLVISGKFIAKEDANPYKGFIVNKVVDIPDSIASKIFRGDGTSLDVAPSTTDLFNRTITEFMYCKNTPAISSSQIILASSYAKEISLTAYGFGATTEDQECFIDLRVQLLVI